MTFVKDGIIALLVITLMKEASQVSVTSFSPRAINGNRHKMKNVIYDNVGSTRTRTLSSPFDQGEVKVKLKVKQKQADDIYYSSSSQSMYERSSFSYAAGSAQYGSGPQKVTLTRYLSGLVQEQPELRELESLLLSVSMACKTISNLINRGNINQPLVSPQTNADSHTKHESTSFKTSQNMNMQQNSMKKLDQLSTQVLRNALRFTGKVSTITPAGGTGTETLEQVVLYDDGPSEHQPGVLIASAIDSKYVAFFDPLDGSGNADATICTGTIFGMFESNQKQQLEQKNTFEEKEENEENEENEEKKENEESEENEKDNSDPLDEDLLSVLQPGRNLRAAGYCLYSSATILVFSLGNGTHGFTLDPQLGEFVLTHPSIKIPPRGTIYSCNEANSETWPSQVQSYLSALKTGNNLTQKKYTQRYVGSMVGDIHRTLMYGGIFFYPEDGVLHPRGNLQLLYKSAPLAYLVAQAGGDSTNGKTGLLDVRPTRVHARSPCFIGSKLDIEEMKTFVQHDD